VRVSCPATSVLRKVRPRGSAGDEQHVRALREEPGQGDLGGGRAVPRRDPPDRPGVQGAPGTERGPGHERDAVPGALRQYRGRRPRTDAVGVLHAHDLRAGQRPAQLVEGDVAQADTADQTVVARADHRLELVVEPALGHVPSISRRFTAASRSVPRLRRFSSMPRRSSAGASQATMPPSGVRRAPTLLTRANSSGLGVPRRPELRVHHLRRGQAAIASDRRARVVARSITTVMATSHTKNTVRGT